MEGETLTETEERGGMAKAAVKLPKIEIKCFSGDYTCWKSFKETFEATVHRRTDLTNIEKFTYLRSLLNKTASQAIEEFPLTADNYTAAWRLLNERFGNEQIIISSHMNKILNISPVYSPNVRSLRELYDNVESNVRALENLGVSYEQFGSLLIPIILEKLPNMIKLQISRKLGSDNWNVQDFLAYINEEILARENYEYLKRENFEDPKPTSTFFTSANVKCCVFCKKDNHYSNQCKIITDVKFRCEFLKKNHLCFNCFKSGHSKKNCKNNIRCYHCKGNHNTALCYQRQNRNSCNNGGQRNPTQLPQIDNKGSKTNQQNQIQHEDGENQENVHESNVEEKLSCLVEGNTSIILQTANAIVTDTYENKISTVKILLDSGSQQTLISEELAKELNLKPVREVPVDINTFMSNHKRTTEFKEYEIIVRAISSNKKLFLKVLGTPTICNTIKGQNIDLAVEQTEFVKGLQLADTGQHSPESKIDILIGSDCSWKVVTAEVKRDSRSEMVAINTIFGWCLSGPFKNKNNISESNVSLVSSTHVMRVACENNEDQILNNLNKFWNLDSIGIKDDEQSVYENFESDIKFENQRYVVKLPVKENRPLLPDNYNVSLKRLYKLKMRLDKNENLLRSYDDIFQEQIKLGIIEEVNSSGIFNNVTYLPHREVVKENHSTTKIRVVFDASVKVEDHPSLNDILYKGPCLLPKLYDLLLAFRAKPIALTGAIEKAFLQIVVHENHRDLLRCLWFKNLFNCEPTEIQTYRFTRLIFGASSSPFLLNATIRKHGQSYEKIDEEFARIVRKNFM